MVKVQKIGGKDADKLIKNFTLNSLIIVTQPDCGHCKLLKPTLDNVYKDLENSYSGDVNVFDVHAEAANEAKETIKDLDVVDGYPTLLISKEEKKPIIYEGDRSKESIIKFMTDNLDVKPKKGGKKKTRKYKKKTKKHGKKHEKKSRAKRKPKH